MRLSIPTSWAPSRSTVTATRAAKAPGDSSVGSTCWSTRAPEASAWSIARLSLRARSTNVRVRSSKRNSMARSPRRAAVTAISVVRTVLPTPVGPMIRVQEPASSPPPSSRSISALPLLATAATSTWGCSEATSRG